MNRLLLTLAVAALAISLLATLAPNASAAPLKLVVHEDSGAEGDPLPSVSRYNALKRSLETALGRPVEISFTRDSLLMSSFHPVS